MYPNPLKEKLRNGQTVLGTALAAPTASVTATTCKANIDFLWMDTEHAPYASESLEVLPVIARQHGVAPMIRVAWERSCSDQKSLRRGRGGGNGSPDQHG